MNETLGLFLVSLLVGGVSALGFVATVRELIAGYKVDHGFGETGVFILGLLILSFGVFAGAGALGVTLSAVRFFTGAAP